MLSMISGLTIASRRYESTSKPFYYTYAIFAALIALRLCALWQMNLWIFVIVLLLELLPTAIAVRVVSWPLVYSLNDC